MKRIRIEEEHRFGLDACIDRIVKEINERTRNSMKYISKLKIHVGKFGEYLKATDENGNEVFVGIPISSLTFEAQVQERNWLTLVITDLDIEIVSDDTWKDGQATEEPR